MSLARLFVACTFTLALVAGCDKKSDPTPTAAASESKKDDGTKKVADKAEAKAEPKAAKVDGPSASDDKESLGLELPAFGAWKAKWDADAKVAKWENEDYDSSIVNRVVKEKLDDIEDLKTAAPDMMQLGSAITKVVEEKKTAKGWYAIVEREGAIELVYIRKFGATVVCSASLKKGDLGKTLTKKEVLDACESLSLRK